MVASFLLYLGAAITYTNWEGGYPDVTSDKQCVCIKPQRRTEDNVWDRKWWTCNCTHSYAVVCQKGVSYGLSALYANVYVSVFY